MLITLLASNKYLFIINVKCKCFFSYYGMFYLISQQLNNFDNNIRKIIYDIGNYGKKLYMILKTIMLHGISNNLNLVKRIEIYASISLFFSKITTKLFIFNCINCQKLHANSSSPLQLVTTIAI